MIFSSIIVFDFKSQEIFICNDAGRMTRPLLKVKNNKLLINKRLKNILIVKKQIGMNFFINHILDESILEYIDCVKVIL